MTGAETIFLVAAIVVIVACTIYVLVTEFDERVIIFPW